MKKIILFTFLLLGILNARAQQEHFSNLDKEKKAKYWNFLDKRLFPQNKPLSIINFPERYYKDIKVYLKNPVNKKDSVFLKKAIKRVQPFIPYSISILSKKDSANFIINMNSRDALNNAIQIHSSPTYGNRDGWYNNVIERLTWNVSLSGDMRPTTSKEKETLFLTLLVRGLVSSRYYRTYSGSIKSNESESILDRRLFPYPEIYKTNFTDMDKFLLQKVYSPDFLEQYKNYVLKGNSLIYYLKYFYNNTMKIIGLIISILLCFLILAIAYNPIFSKSYKFQYYNYLFPAFISTNAVVVSLFLYHNLSAIPASNIIEEIYALLIVNGVLIVMVSILYFVEKYFIKARFSLLKKIFFKALFTLVVLSFIVIFPIVIITAGERKNFPPYLVILLVGIVVTVIRSSFLYLKEKSNAMLREKDVELSKLKGLKAEAEVASLHARINPHFLYNALNSIAGLAHSDADKTEKMALSLSDLFRHNLNRRNEPYSSIQEEIEAVKAYLEIEQIRFGDRLQFNIDVDEKLNDLQVPRNIIQPLIENAVKHGISVVEGQGILNLTVIQNKDAVEISVYDNGPAFPEGIVSGYGLQSIYDILELSYKGKAALSRESEPHKRIWISIQKNELKQRHDAI